VFHQDVGLEVDSVSRFAFPEGRSGKRVWDEGDGKGARAAGEDRQAYAVDGDRTLLDQIPVQGGRRGESVEEPITLGTDRCQPANAVDVALHEVTTQPIGEPESAFEVHSRADGDAAQCRAPQCLGRDVDRKATR